jgi:hypothetical protein
MRDEAHPRHPHAHNRDGFAPRADLPTLTLERKGSTLSGRSLPSVAMPAHATLQSLIGASAAAQWVQTRTFGDAALIPLLSQKRLAWLFYSHGQIPEFIIRNGAYETACHRASALANA